MSTFLGRTFYGPQTVLGVLEASGAAQGDVSEVVGVFTAAAAEEYVLAVQAKVLGGEKAGIELLFECGAVESRVCGKPRGEGVFAQDVMRDELQGDFLLFLFFWLAGFASFFPLFLGISF